MKTSNTSKLGNVLAIGAMHWRWSRQLFSNARLRFKPAIAVNGFKDIRLCRNAAPAFLVLAVAAALPAASTMAADIFWTGGEGRYTNPTNWTGGVLPGSGDHAINNNGSNNVVQINSGDASWSVVDLICGNADNTSG